LNGPRFLPAAVEETQLEQSEAKDGKATKQDED
jgi:hypothetical protein